MKNRQRLIELVLFRDERTRCFIPVVPKNVTPLVTPGHHGTASGNLYSQQYFSVPDAIAKKDTSTAQQLMLGKVLQYINSKTQIFDKNESIRPVHLEHKVLDSLATKFIKSNKPGKSKLILDLYHNVQENDKAFKHFENTSYPYLGSESTSSGARYIHYGAHNYIRLDTIAPAMQAQL